MRCKVPGCQRKMRAKGWCASCYHREWIRIKRRKDRERHARNENWQRSLRLLESAYDGATTVAARLRIRGELETLRQAAN